MTNCNLGNWTKECENILNKQISLELWASYKYLSMWSYFDRSTVGLNKIADFFKKSSDKEREHAMKLIEYQNKRGGTVSLVDIPAPSLETVPTGSNDLLVNFSKAVEMEQTVYQHLLKVHKTGEEHNDPQFTDFIEGEFLEEQIDAINELTKHVSQLKRIGNDGHGLWNFNNHFE